jgi:hypothetical protein
MVDPASRFAARAALIQSAQASTPGTSSPLRTTPHFVGLATYLFGRKTEPQRG